jgi:hypothetical protein
MGMVENGRRKEEVRSVIRFFCAEGIQPIEIHRELVTVYGPGVMAVNVCGSSVGTSKMVG